MQVCAAGESPAPARGSWRRRRQPRPPFGGYNNDRFRDCPRMGDREVDHELVVASAKGDKRAFELLVPKYQRKLGRLLSRLVRDPAEVEDVTQEAFIKAYRALPSFRGDSAFYTWLYRIGDQHREELPRRAGPAGADVDRLRPRGGRESSRMPSSCGTRPRRKTNCWGRRLLRW